MKFKEKLVPVFVVEIDGKEILKKELTQLFEVIYNCGGENFYFDEYEKNLRDILLDRKLIKLISKTGNSLSQETYSVTDEDKFSDFENEFWDALEEVDIKKLRRERKLEEMKLDKID
jgi:alpha-L-fucosidase